MSVDPAERRARAALSRLTEPGDDRLAALVEELGAVEVLARLRERRLPGSSAAHWSARLATLDLRADVARARAVRARYVVPGDDEWPDQLDDLAGLRDQQMSHAARPLGLWVRGPAHLRELTERAIAVVGSRAATEGGCYITDEMCTTLAERGWTIVSGAAYGIDSHAHEGALAGDGPTVAVLACGVDVAYPRAHAGLLARIARSGLVVSELSPGCSPTRVRFLRRNRVIAALAQATVVVEAAHRSGALTTASFADALGRWVGAVPARVGDQQSHGCLTLLRRPGTVLVRGAADVLEVVGQMGVDAVVEGRGPETPLDGLDELTRRVVEALPVRQGAEAASISRVAGLELLSVHAALTRLELAGLAEHRSGLWRRCRPRRDEPGSARQVGATLF
ncbi:MAG TPA: DNA-processing protein DprA [Actinomycetes bacterium]|nr:DNA-processing protein DprA [Actinomycetes bacterium]